MGPRISSTTPSVPSTQASISQPFLTTSHLGPKSRACFVRLVGSGRRGQCHRAPRPDDGRHLPYHALPPGHHRPGRGHVGAPQQEQVHSRPRVGRTPQRTYRGCGSAGPARAPRTLHGSGRHHPRSSHRKVKQLSGKTSSAGPRTPVRSADHQTGRGHRGRRLEGGSLRWRKRRWAHGDGGAFRSRRGVFTKAVASARAMPKWPCVAQSERRKRATRRTSTFAGR